MDIKELQLEKLIKEAKSGSKDAFRAIFERLSNKLFLYAASRTSSRDSAMDAVQETFIDLWKSLKKFEYISAESFHGFVFTIMKGKLSKYYKVKNQVVSLDEKTDAAACSFETKYEDYRHLFKHINSLEEHYQDVLRLRYWADMAFNEIALALNIQENTARVWHHRALQILKVNLNKQNYVS